MNIGSRQTHCEKFYRDALACLKDKGIVHSRDSDSYSEFKFIAKEQNTTVAEVIVLRILAKVHTVGNQMRLGLFPDTLVDVSKRLKDIANFCAILDTWLEILKERAASAESEKDNVEKSGCFIA